MKPTTPPPPKNQTECICQLVGLMRAIIESNQSYAEICEKVYQLGPSPSEPRFFEQFCRLLEQVYEMSPRKNLPFEPAPPLDHWQKESSETT